MRRSWAALLLAIPGTASFAQEGESADGAYLLKVGPGGRHPLYHPGEGCPALAARCRSRAYLVTGDVVVASRTPAGGFVAVRFTNGRGRSTTGYLPAAVLEPLPAPPPAVENWIGIWIIDERSIAITRVATSGHLAMKGLALWGSRDPERVRSGGVNTREFGGEIDVGTGASSVVIEDAEESGCRVRLRLLGPYLLASDNLGCGGVNVTFTGQYAKRVKPPGR